MTPSSSQTLLLQTVLPAFEPEDLEKFMPYTKDELLAMSGLLDPPTPEPPPPPDGTPQFGTVVLRLPRATYDLWKQWKELVEARTGQEGSNERAFEFAIADALAGNP